MISEKIIFQDSLGTNLVGILSRPSDGYDMPVIITSHGFTSNKDRSSYTTLEKGLLDVGIAMFRYDTFGHGESEGDLSDITLSKSMDGCLCAYALMQKKGFTTIGLHGSSFGGCTVLNAAYALGNKIFAVGAKAPVSDYGKQKRRKLGEEGMKKRKETGSMEYRSDRTGIVKANLAYDFYEDMKHNNVHEKALDIDISVCLVHGNKDTTVLPEQSIRTDELLPDSELHILPGVDHYFTGPGETDQANEIFVDFFQRQLGSQ